MATISLLVEVCDLLFGAAALPVGRALFVWYKCKRNVINLNMNTKLNKYEQKVHVYKKTYMSKTTRNLEGFGGCATVILGVAAFSICATR